MLVADYYIAYEQYLYTYITKQLEFFLIASIILITGSNIEAPTHAQHDQKINNAYNGVGGNVGGSNVHESDTDTPVYSPSPPEFAPRAWFRASRI